MTVVGGHEKSSRWDNDDVVYQHSRVALAAMLFQWAARLFAPSAFDCEVTRRTKLDASEGAVILKAI